MYGSYYGSYYYNDSFVLVLLVAAIVLGLIAQARVQSAFKKYSRVPCMSGMSGLDTALLLLARGGSNARVHEVQGSLTDHYSPKDNTVGLSESVYGSRSVAALAVAAHEIGHVMQYQEGYFAIRLRNAVLPVASFGSNAAPFIVLVGFLFNSYTIAMVGVVLFGAMFLFQVITLPVEFNASRRGLTMLRENGCLAESELPGAKAVLRAAAMTYVASALASAANLLRLISMMNRRSSRR